MADAWWLPFAREAALYVALACLHCSLNHGARCFAHLLGFLWERGGVTFSTPALTASAIIKFSMASARASLSFSN